MDSTSASLLRRLRSHGENGDWKRFAEIYTPMIHDWALAQGLGDADAMDLTQDVLTTLVAKLPDFQYDERRSFRAWLKTVTVNRARDYWRRQTARPAENPIAVEEAAAVANHVDVFAEAEYRRRLVGRALQLMQAEFRPTTWQACWKFVAEDRPAAEVARELGISVNAVYVAKSRVLRRLREEVDGLLDPGSV